MDKSIKEAAVLLGVTEKTVRRRIKKGKYPNAYKQDNKYFIPENDLGTQAQQVGTQRNSPDNIVRTNSDPDINIAPEADNRNTPVTDNEPPPPAPAEPQQLAPDYRYRLQIDWPRLGVRFEWRKAMDERLIRDALQWIGRKWAEWREKASSK